MIGRLDAAENELAAYTGLRAGRLRLAAFPSALGTIVPAAAAMLRGRQPGIDLRLTEAEPPEALRMLRAGYVDVALVFRYFPDGSGPDSAAAGEGAEGPAGHGHETGAGSVFGTAGFAGDEDGVIDITEGLRERLILDEPIHLVTAVRGTEQPPELSRYARHRWIAGCDRCRANLLRQCAQPAASRRSRSPPTTTSRSRRWWPPNWGSRPCPRCACGPPATPGSRPRRWPSAPARVRGAVRRPAGPARGDHADGRAANRRRARGIGFWRMKRRGRRGARTAPRPAHAAQHAVSRAEPGAGQAVLPGLDDLRDPAPSEDPGLAAVAAELTALDSDGSRMAAAIRGALDMLLDGQHTGRYRWEQLHKTEKTHAGTLVEIALARSLRLPDGTALDYTIAGADVDCKFSHRLGGWMIPPEADGQLMLLVQASDEDGTWSAGLLRATPENLSLAGNRDGKRALNDRGRAAVCWLHHRTALQENALIRLPEREVAAIFEATSGQQRVNELFRRAQRIGSAGQWWPRWPCRTTT